MNINWSALIVNFDGRRFSLKFLNSNFYNNLFGINKIAQDLRKLAISITCKNLDGWPSHINYGNRVASLKRSHLPMGNILDMIQARLATCCKLVTGLLSAHSLCILQDFNRDHKTWVIRLTSDQSTMKWTFYNLLKVLNKKLIHHWWFQWGPKNPKHSLI